MVDVRNEDICQTVMEATRVWEESEVMGPGVAMGGDGFSRSCQCQHAMRLSKLPRCYRDTKRVLTALSPISWMGYWVHLGRGCNC
jgi:hypothetical protein